MDPTSPDTRFPTPRRIRIAVDGPAGSGKGTVARMVARALGYAYVDTGTLYRTLAWLAARAGVDAGDEDHLVPIARAMDVQMVWGGGDLQVLVSGVDVTSEIRTETMGSQASRVAALPQVRAALLDLQRSMASHGGVVMDGRDIGSVVLPDAELKVFLDATVDERTRRRQLELRGKGIERAFDDLRREMMERDARDRGRTIAPLVCGPDAFHVDSTNLDPATVTRLILEEAHRRGA